MTPTFPEINHVYMNHHLDSTRWEHYTPRTDDIIVATPYKSGTTWTQMIVQHLIFLDLAVRPIWDISPWLDFRPNPLDDVMGRLNAQEHRRCIKTHLPLDGLPYYPQVKYIVVGRDARDVFMSLWNHYNNYTPDMYERFNNTPGRVGPPIPPCPDSSRTFWREWISGGWFAWEREGYPFWSNLRHTQTWWDFRHLPNLLFVHYNDLLRDLEGEIRRIASYLGIAVPVELLPAIVKAVTFRSMKEQAEQIVPSAPFKGGPQAFIYKGTNGRWRNALTDDDLQLYEAAVARELTPDCAQWLERGRLGDL